MNYRVSFCIRFLLTIIVLLMGLGCSSFSHLLGTKIRGNSVVVDQNSTLTDGSGKTREINANEQVVINNGPVFLESPGYIGVLVVPVSPNPKSTHINLRPYNTWSGESFESLIDEKLTEAMDLVTKVQSLMISQKWELALAEVQSGQKKFPYLTYLKFLEASCYSMMGRAQEAQISLKDALGRNPSSVEGRKLYRSLTGQEFKP